MAQNPGKRLDEGQARRPARAQAVCGLNRKTPVEIFFYIYADFSQL
jgi:hypothetical protein